MPFMSLLLPRERISRTRRTKKEAGSVASLPEEPGGRREKACAEARKQVALIEVAEIDRRLSDPELCENTAVARSH